MGLIKLSLISLKKDMSKSFFYFLTYLLTTIFIFSFFNLVYNPGANIHLGQYDVTFTTTICIFVVLIAMICVFLANNFYVSYKSKEISIILMSGASVYQVGIFLFLQVFIIMALSIALGLVCSLLLIPLINGLFIAMFSYQGDMFYLSKEAMIATALIVGFEVMWCSMLNLGYCVRSTIHSMIHEINKIDLSGIKGPRITNVFYLIFYIVPAIIFVFLKDSMSFLFFALIGVVGVYGIIKNVIPQYLKKRQGKESLDSTVQLLAIGYFNTDIQKVFALLITILLASILLTCVTVYTISQPLVSQISLMSYIAVIILLSLTIVFKIGLDLQSREKNFRQLANLGISVDMLYKVIDLEMLLFYGLIVILPLVYQIIMLVNLLLRGQVTLVFVGIILFIQIVPVIISFLLSRMLYRKIVPQSIIQTK